MVDPDIQVHMLRTYVWLRRLIAIVTGLFLVTLSAYREFGTDPVTRNSISAYYYHNHDDFPMQDVYVAALCAIALLLVAYQGYRDLESWALDIGGLALLCVVFFPMEMPPPDENVQAKDRMPTSAHAVVHTISALIFFGSIAYVSIFRAKDTLAAVSSPTRRAAYRRTYKAIGVLMLFVPGLAFVLHFVVKLESTVFWVEYIAVGVFLSYWLIKSMELELTGVETQAKASLLPETEADPPGKS